MNGNKVWLDLGPLCLQRIRYRQQPELRSAVADEAKKRGWQTLSDLVRYLESAGLAQDPLTCAVRGLVEAEEMRNES